MAVAAKRNLRPLLAGVFLSLGFLFAGCGTDATGIETCRAIEEERCRQAPACPSQFRIETKQDVEGCVRFYHDQCLHGLSSEEPGKPALEACLQTIRRAGECARSGAATLAECGTPPSEKTSLNTACEVLLHPEKTAECAFLIPLPEEPEPAPAPVEDAGGEDTNGEDAATEAGTEIVEG